MTTARQDLTLTWIMGALLAHPALSIGLPLALAFLAALASLVMRPQYTSRAAFVPESRALPTINPSLLGLASQFGVNLGGQSAQSPQFYAEVLRSREILEAVLATSFARPTAAADSAPLLDLLLVRGPNAERRMETGAKLLNARLALDVDPRTSIVRIAVELPGPHLAQAVTSRFLELLNEFNLRRRQSQARERRRFTEQRLQLADSSLRAAEDRIRAFYETNRLWQNSPSLTFEEARLRRELSLRQELQLLLSRELETARLEEVNDTPVLTVVDRADVPQRRSRPRRKVIVVAAGILGAIAGSALALALQSLDDLCKEGHPDLEFVRAGIDRLRRRYRGPARSDAGA